jgi:hypothetical protein
MEVQEEEQPESAMIKLTHIQSSGVEENAE